MNTSRMEYKSIFSVKFIFKLTVSLRCRSAKTDEAISSNFKNHYKIEQENQLEIALYSFFIVLTFSASVQHSYTRNLRTNNKFHAL